MVFIDYLLIGLIILFVILGLLLGGKRLYTIRWLDTEKKGVHSISGLDDHEKSIVMDALKEASNSGKVVFSSITYTKDKNNVRT
jgi:hypothetical protein